MRIRNYLVLLALFCGCNSSSASRRTGFLECEPASKTGTLPSELKEASGVAVSRRNPGILWVHNDDNPPVVFAIDSTGALKGRVRVPNVQNTDWEDIAVGPCGAGSCLFIGDIGDNKHKRTDRAVYQIDEPLVTDTVSTAPIRYPFHLAGMSHDAEALFVMPDSRMYVVTKGRGGAITVYRYPLPAQPDVDVELEPTTALSNGLVQFPDMVTGAGATPDGHFIAIRTYSAFQIFRMQDEGLQKLLKHPYDLTKLREPQGEGVDIRADGVLFFVGEKGPTNSSPASIARVQCHLPPA